MSKLSKINTDYNAVQSNLKLKFLFNREILPLGDFSIGSINLC